MFYFCFGYFNGNSANPNVWRIYSSVHLPAANWQKQCNLRAVGVVFVIAKLGSHLQCLILHIFGICNAENFMSPVILYIMVAFIAPSAKQQSAGLGVRLSRIARNRLFALNSVILSALYNLSKWSSSGQRGAMRNWNWVNLSFVMVKPFG